MKAVVARVVRESPTPVTIDEVDISTDADLEARFGLEIPVLLIDGRKAAKYRVTEGELTRILTGRSGRAGGPDRKRDRSAPPLRGVARAHLERRDARQSADLPLGRARGSGRIGPPK